MAKARRTESRSERTGLRAWASPALTGATLGLGLGACIWGASWVNARATGYLAAPQTTIDIAWPEIADAPGQTWLPEDVQNELLAVAYERVERSSASPLDGRVLGEIAADLTESGWFERVDAVERTRDAGIRVRGSWRTPTAWVRFQDRDYLVAGAGELLPTAWSVEETTLPRIVAPKAAPPRREGGRAAYGAAWEGADVRAGLLLLRLVSKYPFASQIRGVDVAGYEDRQRLELITDRGTRVVWGSAPGDFKPGEVTTRVKLERLALLASGREYANRIDAGEEKLEICGPYMEVVRVAERP